MSILTPEAGQPYIRHVIFSFGIRPVASRLRAAQRRCMSEIGSDGGCPDREVAPKVLPYDKTNSASVLAFVFIKSAACFGAFGPRGF